MKVSDLFEASAPNMKKVEQELKAHAQTKLDYEKEFGPMSAPDLHSHEVKRKQLLKKLSIERSKANVAESADYAKALVRGEKAAPGIMNKLRHWLDKLMIVRNGNRFVPANVALEQLKKAGFDEDQIYLIRDAATVAANTAVKTIQQKYGDRVPDEYVAALPTSFGVYNLFLNVAEEIHDEFNELVKKLFDAKLDKIKDKLIIKK